MAAPGDLKISDMDEVTTFKVGMIIPVVDEEEADPLDRNKRLPLSSLLGLFRSFSGTSYTYGDQSEVGPALFSFTGTSQCTFTFPAGSDNIVNMPLWFVNNGTADLLLDGDGSDTVTSGGDPFVIAATDNKIYMAKWSGSTWFIQ
jgi:hypothetical protein